MQRSSLKISHRSPTRGGTYSVRSTRGKIIPLPKDLTYCGIDKLDVATIELENMLLDTVRPSLPEIDIRILKPTELHPKVLLLVCHPASWARPHMVEGYDQGRYYRRGNYRAVLTKELAVESAYQTSQRRLM